MGLNIKLIPYRRVSTKPNELCVISGWGLERESMNINIFILEFHIYNSIIDVMKIILIFLDATVGPIRLKRADIQTINYDQCKRIYSSLLTNNMICAASVGRDSCQVSKI